MSERMSYLSLERCQQRQQTSRHGLQAKEIPLQELVALLQLFLSSPSEFMQHHYQQHTAKLNKLAAAAVEAAEKASLAHSNKQQSEAVPNTALQDKVAKAAYAAAAVAGLTAQVSCLPTLIMKGFCSTHVCK